MRAWLLLLHKPGTDSPYLRVKVWRRLRSIGAVQLRNAAYALPACAETRGALSDVAAEIEAGGGLAVLAEARLASGLNDAQVVSAFQAARDRDYSDLMASLPVLRAGARPTSVRRAEIAAALGRARRRLREIQGVDFFGAPRREAAASAIAALEHQLIPSTKPAVRPIAADDLLNRTWVTRQGVHVDRMACTWLIRRFIDPKARFRFVPGLSNRSRKNELRFDMADGEFTHVEDRCSFEVLLARAGLADAALTAVAEIVHDLDLEDGKFGRAETAGVQRVISGILATQGDDLARIARASAVFDDLYESFRRAAHPGGRRGRAARKRSIS